MEVDTLLTELDFVCSNGTLLNAEERGIIHNSLTLLKLDGKFKKLFFWGKVVGTDNDYYLAQGMGNDVLRNKQKFYSLNGKKWVLLTAPEPMYLDMSKHFWRQFTGDPTTELEIKIPTYRELEEAEESLQGEEGEEEEEEEEAAGTIEEGADTRGKAKEMEIETGEEFEEQEVPMMAEEDRLSCTFYLLDQDIAIAPRGAYIRMPNGEVLVNQFFNGLDAVKAQKSGSYSHVRFPRRTISDKRRKDCEMDKSIDFLDIIEEDIPKGCWSIQVDSIRGLVLVRNLWWPGMVFYHRLNTPKFGYIYIGCGMKNRNLPFML